MILVATSALIGVLGDDHGDAALVGYSALATALALALGLWLEQSGRDVAPFGSGEIEQAASTRGRARSRSSSRGS